MNTSRWYAPYQRLVRSVPVLGSVSTKHWYYDETFPYCFSKTLHGGGINVICNLKSFIIDRASTISA
ncbi:MAG: hypothetical protein SPI30_01780 [Prevotella sp.]|nr:hypothetical protein [Prevotella sp.]